MKREELFEKAEIIVDEYFHEFTEGRLERDQMIDAIWKLAEQYHEARMREECCHPFERVISAGALHNCTVCGQNIEVWKEYLRKQPSQPAKTSKR